MSTEHISIELIENGFAGLVKQDAYPGHKLPDLIAHRPEPWRFFRLARVLGAAKVIADLELGAGEGEVLVQAMASISDYKGDFGVVWRRAAHSKSFESIVNRALASEGEEEILHGIESDS